MNRALLFLFFLFFCLSANAQKISIRADDQPLRDVLESLEEDYGFEFSYAHNAIQDVLVNCEIEDKSIDTVIQALLSSTSLEYKRVNNNILLRDKDFEVPSSSLNLYGRVMDDKSSLPAANIYIEGTTLGTYADDDGRFQLEVPLQYVDKQITISYLGYQDATFQIKDHQDKTILVQLQESPYTVQEVVISNKEKQVQVMSYDQYQRISTPQLGASSLAGADLSKSLQLLPGISGFDDTSADIKIRGSNADATLIILDGMPLYGTAHYYGIFSALNTNYIDQVDIYKNNLPLKYGNKTAGVVDIKSNSDDAESVAGKAEINLLTTNAVVNTPIHDHTHLKLAARTTVRNISNTQFNTFAPKRDNQIELQERENQSLTTIDPSFKFYDFNTQLNHDFDPNNRISINLFKSNDAFSSSISSQFTGRQGRNVILDNSIKEQWENDAFSIYSKNKVAGHDLHTTLYSTRYKKSSSINIGIKESVLSDLITVNDYGYIHDLGIDSHMDIDFKGDSLTIGASVVNHSLDYYFKENKSNIIEGNVVGNAYSTYVNYASHISDLQYNIGLRGTYYDITKNAFLSPRISLNYDVAPRLRLKSSYGFYSQNIRELSYEYRGEYKSLWVSSDERKPTLFSHNTMIGLTTILDFLTIDVEAYYKAQDGVMELVSIFPGKRPEPMGQNKSYAIFSGLGRSYGVDVLLSSGYNNYNTYLAYTLSKIEHSFNEIAKGAYLPAEDDRRHQFKWMNTYDIGHLSLSADYVYASGRRYTDLFIVGKDGDIRNNRNRFSRLKPYSRFDLGAQYKIPIKDRSIDIGLSILNVFNNQNVKFVQSFSSFENNGNNPINKVIGNESALLARTFNASVRFNF